MKEEAVDCTLWRTCFGTGYGPDVRRRRNKNGPNSKILAKDRKVVCTKDVDFCYKINITFSL